MIDHDGADFAGRVVSPRCFCESRGVHSTDEFVIRAVPLEEVIDLRHRVLRSGLSRDAAYLSGDEKSDAWHWAAFHADRGVIGCATLHLAPLDGVPAGQLRGMAVDAEFRRYGLGRQLLLAVEQAVRDKDLSLIWANCRTPALPFYRRMGWEIISEEFVIETAGPHFRMKKVLGATR